MIARGCWAVAEPGLTFAGLLRQLRAEARLTQEELAEAASVSPRSVSDLERGINRTARRDTALLLADALGLAGPARELFIAVARGRAPTAEMLAAARGTFAGAIPGLLRDGGSVTGGQAELAWLLGAVIDSPYRGLAAFEEQDAAFFFGREAATAPARPPWRSHPGRPQIPSALRPGATSRSSGCCWWWTSSRSCSPSAPMRGSGGRSSPPCTPPPPPPTGPIRHRPRWPCWACA